MKHLPSAIALLVALTAPAFAQNAHSIADEANRKWMQAYAKGDAPALTALYAKDAVLISPVTAAPVMGEANIRKYYEADLQHPLSNMSITSTESKMLNPDTVIDAGTWTAEAPGEKGGAPMNMKGTYIQTLVHKGSAWLLRSDAASMALPPPAK